MIRYSFFFWLLSRLAMAQDSSPEMGNAAEVSFRNLVRQCQLVPAFKLGPAAKVQLLLSSAPSVPRWEYKSEPNTAWAYEFWPNRSGELGVRTRYSRLGLGNGFGPRMANVLAEAFRMAPAGQDISPLQLPYPAAYQQRSGWQPNISIQQGWHVGLSRWLNGAKRYWWEEFGPDLRSKLSLFLRNLR